ncbi:hypothetical protein [Streptomyces sp. NPDC087294]|uniref:hypothetical protein n=1 Tax=Streptomyces sp. NPDC087294 TaxID=3365777 RepID=UPI00380EF47F
MTRNTDPVRYPRTAADAVHAFNHTTLIGAGRPALAYPGTLHRTVDGFASLAIRLPQAFDQIGLALASLYQSGHLTADHGTPTEHAGAAAMALRDAEHHANAMALCLQRAWTATNPLGWNGPLNDHDDDL